MKKAIPCLMFLLFIFGFGMSASAENHAERIDIDVIVQDDGSAYVLQTWKGVFDEGTENFIPIDTGDIEISDLTVSDEKGKYKTVSSWDTRQSFKEKARKCGINETADGAELCFGISQYGNKTYYIRYTVRDFIKSYSDYDGTNFMFINSNMNTFPTEGRINIRMENGAKLSEENAGIWAFGFEGQIEFRNGSVKAYTDYPLEGDHSMIVLLKLNKGIIHPAKSLDKSFEEVKEEAMEGSDYGDDGAPLWLTVLILAIAAIVILIAVYLIKRKKAIKKFYKDVEYFRDVPNKGDLEVSHFLAQTFDVAEEESLIIGAALLSMINRNFIEPQTNVQTGMFGKTKTSVNLKLCGEPKRSPEKQLYRIVSGAAGADGILQEKELEKYARKHPELLESFVKKAAQRGEKRFAGSGGFTGGSGNCINDLSENGKRELAEVMGLKKFLTDFSLIAEREIKETAIWQDYLVYATLFGIAEKTIRQFEKVYPSRTEEIRRCSQNAMIAGSYYHTVHSSYQKALNEKRNAGGGGSSSVGGGGGFSGGGFGGGSR